MYVCVPAECDGKFEIVIWLIHGSRSFPALFFDIVDFGAQEWKMCADKLTL